MEREARESPVDAEEKEREGGVVETTRLRRGEGQMVSGRTNAPTPSFLLAAAAAAASFSSSLSLSLSLP